jgi:YVTN family beta-propeller protein
MKWCMVLLLAMGAAQSQPVRRVFVVNKGGDSVAIVNAASLRVEKTIPVGRNPHELAVAPNGSRLYVPNVAGNSISVIDPRTGLETKKILHSDFNSPHGIAFTPNSQRALVTSEGSSKIFVIDAVADQVIKVVDTDQGGTHMAAVNRAGTRAYFTNRQANTVSFMDLDNYRIVANVAVGRGAEGFALSPNEKEIWVGNRTDATISIIDVARRDVVATIPAKTNPIRLAFTPDGKYVLAPDGASASVDVYEVSNRKKIETIAVGSNPAGVVVAPDGMHAYVACQSSGEIQVIDTQSWKVSGKIAVGASPDGIAIQ